jgi:NADH-quinone oxidoreductase subunit C
MSDNPRMDVPDSAADEQAALREAGLAVQLSEQLARLRDHLVEAFPALEVLGFRGELTVIAPPEQIADVLAFCRDDAAVRCELLADLSCVHWPGGQHAVNAQETTGWPTYTEDAGPGRIEVDYVLYSVTHNHRFRVRTAVSDDGGHLASATPLWASANVMEREAYDFFGVVFDGHPKLTRMHMPEDWEGHPQRKDYPLGGVEVQYKGATVPPPDERKY